MKIFFSNVLSSDEPLIICNTNFYDDNYTQSHEIVIVSPLIWSSDGSKMRCDKENAKKHLMQA